VILRPLPFIDEIAFLPKTFERMQSKVLSDRIAALKTISHEWWHAMKTGQKNRTFAPFEEGGADLFSEMVVRQRTGAKMELTHAYKPFKDAVKLLTDRFGEEWLLKSRSAPNARQYLRETFEQAGFPKDKIEGVLSSYFKVESNTHGEMWLDHVKDLLKSNK
jgi:hypothetical protein